MYLIFRIFAAGNLGSNVSAPNCNPAQYTCPGHETGMEGEVFFIAGDTCLLRY